MATPAKKGQKLLFYAGKNVVECGIISKTEKRGKSKVIAKQDSRRIFVTIAIVMVVAIIGLEAFGLVPRHMVNKTVGQIGTKAVTLVSIVSSATTVSASSGNEGPATAAEDFAGGSSGQSHALGFSFYTNLSTLVPVVKPFYSRANSSDLLIDDEFNGSNPRAYLNYYSKPQAFPRLMLANNYSELISTALSPYVNDVALAKSYNFTSSDYIAYDIEDWSLTPLLEQTAEAAYTQLACNYVHSKGYKFGFTPEVDVPGWGQFAAVNWTCVNFLDLQEQFMTSSSAGLIQNVTQLLAVSKAKNPNLVVFVQLDMQAASQSVLESDILAMSMISGVNGVMIQDLCASNSCNSELSTLLNYTLSIAGTKGSTTATTTATTSATTTIAQSSGANPTPSGTAQMELPASVAPSGMKGSVVVDVSGSGFSPDSLVNIGYSSNFPPDSDAIASTTTSSSGTWSSSFTAPWSAGSYKMMAIDAKGTSASATLVVSSASTGGASIAIPQSAPSTGAKDVKVTVTGSGFTPGAHINFGYSANFPPNSDAILASTVSSSGTWSGTFTAPWNAGSYGMTAIDSKGVSATATLVVT